VEVFDAIFRWSDSGGIYLYDQTSVKSRSAGLISYHGNIFVRPSHTFQKIMATSTETNLFQLSQEWGDASISSTFTVGNLMQCTRIFGLSVDVRPSTFVGVSGHQSIYYWLVVWNMFYIVLFFFSICWEFHHPNWLIFFRGVGGSTTNQIRSGFFSHFLRIPMMWWP